jgi:hypothetical protein
LNLNKIKTLNVILLNHFAMTKPANSTDKPSPTDTPTERPHDNGHKSVVKKSDKQYTADQPHGGDIAKRHEREEQPVDPIKTAPKN